MIFYAVALSLVGELSPEDQRGRCTGPFGLSQTVGTAMGPLIGGVLIEPFSPDARLVWTPISSVAMIAAAGYYYRACRFASEPQGVEHRNLWP
jgi:MFS family permease